MTANHHAVHSINLGVHGSGQTEQRRLDLEYVQNLQSDCGPDSCPILFEYNAGVSHLADEHYPSPSVTTVSMLSQ
jgi:hypothetical protein